jgi:hypothetical protein
VAVRRQLRAAVHAVVQLERRRGLRRVISIATVTPDGVEEVSC